MEELMQEWEQYTRELRFNHGCDCYSCQAVKLREATMFDFMQWFKKKQYKTKPNDQTN